MVWVKVPDAAERWAGGVNPKVLYRAIRDGHLRAARIGSGRNLLVCEAQVDEWLLKSVGQPRRDQPTSIEARS